MRRNVVLARGPIEHRGKGISDSRRRRGRARRSQRCAHRFRADFDHHRLRAPVIVNRAANNTTEAAPCCKSSAAEVSTTAPKRIHRLRSTAEPVPNLLPKMPSPVCNIRSRESVCYQYAYDGITRLIAAATVGTAKKYPLHSTSATAWTV